MSEADSARRLPSSSARADDLAPARSEEKAPADDFALAASDPRTKGDPESLNLRAEATRVVRFRRGLLIGAAAAVLAIFVAVSWFALEPAALNLAASEQEPVPALSGSNQCPLPSTGAPASVGQPRPSAWNGCVPAMPSSR